MQVFNKCYNYEAYEPLTISNYCDISALCKNKLDIDCIFSDDLKQWLANKLNMNDTECINARILINSYKIRIPKVNENLNDLLDPTHNDKLLQIIAYDKFAVLLNKDHHFVLWDGENI